MAQLSSFPEYNQIATLQTSSTKVHPNPSLLVLSSSSVLNIATMCVIDSTTCSCSHVENIYAIECGTAGNRCAKQINRSTSASACRKCLAHAGTEERKIVIAGFYDNVMFYLTNALEITDRFDHDVLAPQVQEIVKTMEEQKAFALLELELKIACEAQKKKEYHDDPSVWF